MERYCVKEYSWGLSIVLFIKLKIQLENPSWQNNNKQKQNSVRGKKTLFMMSKGQTRVEFDKQGILASVELDKQGILS